MKYDQEIFMSIHSYLLVFQIALQPGSSATAFLLQLRKPRSRVLFGAAFGAADRTFLLAVIRAVLILIDP